MRHEKVGQEKVEGKACCFGSRERQYGGNGERCKRGNFRARGESTEIWTEYIEQLLIVEKRKEAVISSLGMEVSGSGRVSNNIKDIKNKRSYCE